MSLGQYTTPDGITLTVFSLEYEADTLIEEFFPDSN